MTKCQADTKLSERNLSFEVSARLCVYEQCEPASSVLANTELSQEEIASAQWSGYVYAIPSRTIGLGVYARC